MLEEPEAPTKIFGWLQSTLGAGLCTFFLALGTALVALAKDKLPAEAPWILAGCLALFSVLVIWTGVATARRFRRTFSEVRADLLTQIALSPSQRDVLSFLYGNYGTSYKKGELQKGLQVVDADVSLDLGVLVRKGLVVPPSKKFWDGEGPRPDGYHLTDAGVAEANK